MTKIAQINTNLSKKVSIHGLDVGNATLINHKGLIIDAKTTQTKPLGKSNKFVIDGKTYYLGDGSYDTEFRKVDKANYLNFLFGLLALSTNTTHNCISVGLPLGQIQEDASQLTNLIMNNNEKIVRINDKEKTLIIDDVFVAPEGVATLDDSFEGIVIDIGGGTTDTALVVNERGVRKIINPISIPKGTIKLYDGFANKLINKGLDISIEDAERILNRGYLYEKGSNDIDFALEEYNDFTEKLISKLQLNYNLKIYPISITGGGGELIYNQLESRLNTETKTQNIILQPEPIKANARNFYELGTLYFEEE